MAMGIMKEKEADISALIQSLGEVVLSFDVPLCVLQELEISHALLLLQMIGVPRILVFLKIPVLVEEIALHVLA